MLKWAGFLFLNQPMRYEKEVIYKRCDITPDNPAGEKQRKA